MYISVKNNTISYPYSIKKLKQDNPQVSFPDTIDQDTNILAEYGVYKVLQVPYPNYSPKFHKLSEAQPSLIEGIWTQMWQLVELTPQEQLDYSNQLSIQMRNQRNGLLSQSDWTQVADAPVDQQAWATYRQALRDVTQQPEFPLEIIWPTQPE